METAGGAYFSSLAVHLARALWQNTAGGLGASELHAETCQALIGAGARFWYGTGVAEESKKSGQDGPRCWPASPWGHWLAPLRIYPAKRRPVANRAEVLPRGEERVMSRHLCGAVLHKAAEHDNLGEHCRG